MLLAFLSILVVGVVVTLIAFIVHAATSARSMWQAVTGARDQLMPAVVELTGTARQIAERLQRLHPEG